MTTDTRRQNSLLKSVMGNRNLIYSLIKREVIGRYKGSVMGLLWSFFNPVLMLVVYTFVFSIVFKTRWPGGSESKTEFALILFAGLMIFNLFSECTNRAPNLILNNVNYVKKIIFPLEIFPIVTLGSAFFHFCISLLVWVIFYTFSFGPPSLNFFLLPIALIPLILMTLGLCWFLASIGVYLRDVSQIIGVTMTVLMFLSPVFYPVSALPAAYQPYMRLNPLTFAVEQARNVMIFAQGINWRDWSAQMIFGAVIVWLGFSWFQKTRRGFADVL